MTGSPWVFLLCAAAGSLAATKITALTEARSALDAGRCEEASGRFLAARQAGDSSYAVLVGLARSLECTGRIEEALGATYVGSQRDTVGRIDLLVERVLLMRRLGLEDLARQTEKEIGIAMGSAARSGGSGWTWSWIPTLGGSLSWMDQTDQQHSAKILDRNDSLLSARSTGSALDVAPVSDTISLKGGSLQTAASLSWGLGRSSGGVWFGPSGNVALYDDSIGWRNVSGGIDLDGYWNPSSSVSVQTSLSGSRTWYAAQTGPKPTEDDLSASLVPAWIPARWNLSLPQSLRVYRTNSGDWTWTGSHGAAVSRELFPRAKISAGGSWSWNLDPAGSVDEYLDVRVVEGEGLDSTKKLYDIPFYTRDGVKSGIFATQFLATGSVDDDLQVTSVPYSRNTDWTQVAFNGAVTLGPWASVILVLSGKWAETDYSHDQEGVALDRSLAAQNSITANGETDSYLLVLRDSTTKKEFVVGSTTSSVALVPWKNTWKIHRRDQCWAGQAMAIWRARKWLSFRASWARSKNISNLEDYVTGASYVRDVVSLTGALSW